MKQFLAFLVALTWLVSPLLAGEGFEAKLLQTEKLFQRGQFEKVVIQGTALLSEPGFSKSDSIKTIRLLAKSAAQENDLKLAENWLLVLIKLDPDTDFNSNKISIRFANLWHKVKKETSFVPGYKQKMLTVATIEFANGSFVDADKVSNVGIGVASMISYQLAESGDIHVPSRENINYLLKELEMSQSDLVDSDQKVAIGKVIGVRNYIFGTFYNMPKKKFRIDARIIDTETSVTKKQFSVEGKSDKIGELTAELGAQVLAYFNVEADKIKQAGARIPDIDLAALVKFSQGIAYEEIGKPELARKAYAEAFEIAPSFALADESREGVVLDIAQKP